MNVVNSDKVKDPPHLGFTQSSIQTRSERNDKLDLVLKGLKIRTSTPKLEQNKVMDTSFSKYYQSVTTQIDNDSGYISQNQESNSELLLEGSSARALSISKTVYLCEDALLERPDFKSQSELSESDKLPEDNEEDRMSGSCERIDASVSSVSERFSVLRGSIESNNSDSSLNSQGSAVIPKINPIIIHECNKIEICDTNDNSNIENNINILNIFNNSKTSNVTQSATKVLNESTESAKSFGTVGSFVEEPLSPELFSDEDILANRSVEEKPYQHVVYKEKYVLKRDEKLIKNVQSTLSGVLPPPSLTIIRLSVEQILEKIEANKHMFWTEGVNQENVKKCQNDDVMNSSNEVRGSLLLTTRDKECVNTKFPEVMEHRYHGLHYNRSKYSEDFESLCMKYAERYIGCETQSTCVVFQQPNLSSPMKRKANKLRWAVKSPGRRLSHLAKRRITFSSANLQASSAANASNSQTRQVVMDSRRFQLLSRKKSPFKKSPRRTPKKSPRTKIRTPSSSAKKRLSLQLQSISRNGVLSEIPTTTRASTTKRALFQSPEKLGSSLSKPLFPSTSGTSSLSPFKRRTTPKCALFTSPSKSSVPPPSRNDNKRKRTDSEDIQVTKLSRSVSLQESGASNSSVKMGLSRVKSDLSLAASQGTGELSALHRKKLQWAVYEALRSQNIGINHPQFKQFASVLARVTKRFLPNLSANVPRPEGGTSDRMLRIARQNIYAVTKGKSVDEIVHDFEQNRLKNLKPTGYVGLDNVSSSGDISIARNKENVFKDRLNTMSSEKQKLGLNREELIKTTLPKFENRVDRARRIINFDNENSGDIR